jgi:hypothetical protein
MAAFMRRALVRVLLAVAVCLVATPTRAQAPLPPQAGAPAPAPPPIRRWLEWQALTLMSRYRFVENSADVVTANQIQYKNVIRGRVNLDARKRYAVNFGVFTGQNFIATWNNTSVGTGDLVLLHSLKQLYVSAAPISGLEVQYGGLYLSRGEVTEIASYDDDGYIVGERVSVRRPADAFFDEISATRAFIGPFTTPSLTDRWEGLHASNYRQLLLARHVTARVKASADYTYDQGADVVRAAMAVTLPARAPVSQVRYEQYWRATPNAAAGFAVTVDRAVTRHARVSGGYTTIDEFYGGWNADKMQRGKRFFATVSAPLPWDFTLQFFATQAVDVRYALTNRTRADVQINYDLLKTLQRARVF